MTQGINFQYAVTRYPTPLFNTQNISNCFGGEDGDSLFLDEKNLMRSLETVLYPQTKVELIEQVVERIWKIQTREYNYGGQYYIDDRFIQHLPGIPSERTISVPPLPSVILKLRNLVGTRYIWGGNWPHGIDLISHLYRSRTPFNQLPALVQDTWRFKGVDCSGLFHFVSNGYTERNTSSLVHFGVEVSIENLSLEDIMKRVHDLDLIVWEGHVVGVLDHKTVIESRYMDGVITVDLKERLLEIMEKRKPVNNWNKTEGSRFVIRRWHPDNV